MPARRSYQVARNAHAQALGYRNFHDLRMDVGGFRALSRADPRTLPERVQAKRLDALNVVRDVRDGFTPESAARYHGVSPDAVRTFTGDAIDRDADRLARPIVVIGRNGSTEVVVRGSRAASDAAAHRAAVDHYLRTGDTSRLREFRGVRVGGVRLETDTRVLRRLAREGRLPVEQLYFTTGRTT